MASCRTQTQQPPALSMYDFGCTTSVGTGSFPLNQCSDASSASRCSYAGQVPHPSSPNVVSPAVEATQANGGSSNVNFLVRTPGGRTAQASVSPTASYDCFMKTLLESAARRDTNACGNFNMLSMPSSFTQKRSHKEDGSHHHTQGHQNKMKERRVRQRVEGIGEKLPSPCQRPQRGAESASRAAFIMHKGRILDRDGYRALLLSSKSRNGPSEVDVSIRVRLRGGVSTPAVW